jgi:hypothetical protein
MITDRSFMKHFFSKVPKKNIPAYCFLLITLSLCDSVSAKSVKIIITPDSIHLITNVIQKAIDSCSHSGGGIVYFPSGKFLTGSLRLQSNVTLHLEKGALIEGSAKYSDYENDAFLYGKDLSDIRIEGAGIIDGVDCYNPAGEEGFRGPHCIKLLNCKRIYINGVTIQNSANWAINCRYCSLGNIAKVKIRGGHDGIHTRFCNGFKISRCDIRTGDDAFAGNDNKDFEITHCMVNSSCNGFRMGCLNLLVSHCTIWGPGEYMHKMQKRNNMLSAFVHFSPKDENPKLVSGNWRIKHVTITGADNVYVYNYEAGLWQTGMPVTNISFEKVTATGILNSFNITGDSGNQFILLIKDSSFSFSKAPGDDKMMFEGVKYLSPAIFNFNKFGMIELKNIVINNSGGKPLMNCVSGKTVHFKNVIIN